MNDAIADLAADGADCGVGFSKPELVRRQQVQWKALRRELRNCELDRAIAVAARALDRDRLLRQFLQGKVWKLVELALDKKRAGAPLERVDPGDIVVADDDGIVVVPRADAEAVLEASRSREEKEDASRARYAAGELSLDVQGMREDLARKGLTYVDE